MSRGETGGPDDGRDDLPTPVVSDRWAVATGITLLAVGLGLVTQNRVVLVSAVVPLVFVAYARIGSVPTPEVTARRSFEPADPAVGDRVSVTVTVRNQGRALRDCRLADGVPDALAVVEGAPAAATGLRPGEETEFTYAVRARRGVHEFGPLRVASSSADGASAESVELAAESRLRCRATVDVEVEEAPSAVGTGDAGVETRGGGVEFQAIREYHRSDPLSRVDWRRFARTGELATVEFREDRAATVAVVVDATAPSYRRPDPTAPAAVEYTLYAAEGAFEALIARDASVALAFHPDAPDALAPGTGVDHLTRGRRAFDAYGLGATCPPEEVPVALGAAGRPTARRIGPGTGTAATGRADDGSGTAVSGAAADPAIDDVLGRSTTGGSSELRSDGGNDPLGNALDPSNDGDGPKTMGGTDGRKNGAGDAAGSTGGEQVAGWTVADAFDEDDGTGGTGDDEPDPVTALRASLPSRARVLFCSPLLDEAAVDLVGALRADEHDVRVLSPGPDGGTQAARRAGSELPARLAGFERADRVTRLQAAGVGVVDWADEPLREALARALQKW